MKSIDHMVGDMSVEQLLRYHGFHERECPLHNTHELTIASDTYAVCHSCGIVWDIVELYLHLAGSDVLTGAQELPEDSESTEGHESANALIACHAGCTPQTEPSVAAITEDFVSWLQSNRQHIYGLRDFDGNMTDAVAFITCKENLCLLPCVIEHLTFSQLRELEETWLQNNFIYLPEDKKGLRKGLKRTQRLPVELRKTISFASLTLRLYTFHRRETLQILGLPDKYQAV